MDTTAPVLPVYEDTRPMSATMPLLGGERELLDAWLDMYRETALIKVAGLTAEQLCRRAVPPSNLSLMGILRHLTEVEAYWLREVLHGEDVADLYSTREDPDGDIEQASAQTAAEDLAAYRAEVARSREAAASWGDLAGPVRGLRRGEQLNLRWILTHLIEEYARHLGHMDLLREATDGSTGY
ncbi:DinB family protein [Brachybacterium hainanense]|uniref:DinB family protein n=1 Tax=Brachybacterium hainanense TaxID=1541174 RepID=A0ABV6R9L8_9MICO